MVRGKPWSAEDEKKLLGLVKQKKTTAQIASALGKTKDSFVMKCSRLGLVVEEEAALANSSSSLELPDELPSVEEALPLLSREG